MEKSKIMLVEDEPSIADTVVYALESEGYAVAWSKTGRGAVDQIREASPDLVILDIGLPDVSGFDVFREIRTFSQAPVIFLTARLGTVLCRVRGNDAEGKIVFLNSGHNTYSLQILT